MQMNLNTSLGQVQRGRQLLQNPDSITEPPAFPRHPGQSQVQQPFPSDAGRGHACLVKDPKSQGRKNQRNPCLALEPLVQLGGRSCRPERGQLVPALS